MQLVGKDKPEDIKIALIENAADVYDEGSKDWMYDNRTSIQAHKFQVDLVDLESYRRGEQKGLLARLERADVIWLGGGNTYYLRWILKETRADSILSGLVTQGKVYGGGSAGAIVAGPTIDHFQPADDPSKAPQELHDGLKLTENVIIPHWANEKYGNIMQDIKIKLEAEGYKAIEINDNQAVVIDGNDVKIV